MSRDLKNVLLEHIDKKIRLNRYFDAEAFMGSIFKGKT